MTNVERAPEEGFTLIEAVIAILILTVSLLGLAQLIMIGLEKHEFAKYDTKATNVAQTKMEELKTLYGWQIDSGQHAEDLAVGNHGPIHVSLKPEGGSRREPTDFWVRWEVANLAAGQKRIAVSVSPPVLNPRFNEVVIVTSVFAP